MSKRRAPKIQTICLMPSSKSWIWDQYLPENMKWTFGKSLKLWNQETLKPRNQETLKPRNFENKKLWNQEPLKPRSQETLKPRNPKPRNQYTFLFSSNGIPCTKGRARPPSHTTRKLAWRHPKNHPWGFTGLGWLSLGKDSLNDRDHIRKWLRSKYLLVAQWSDSLRIFSNTYVPWKLNLKPRIGVWDG